MTLPRLYVIVDSDLGRAHGWNVPALARACLEGGARLLQIRAKTAGASELLAWCEEVATEAVEFGARVVVNDRADVARLISGAGVHVGQDDLPPALARDMLGPDVIVGLSTHTAAQVRAAVGEPVSYLATGPVFGTRTKKTGYEAVGLELVRYAAGLGAGGPGAGDRHRPGPGDQGPTIPVVGIGGITLDTARSVIEAGAASIAVISDVLSTGDPAARVHAYVERLG